ncbi:hypothetical protein D1007_26112 [Hordeum vulgare]|nr:hypothetical protein D1007_26112 [Hordeum vulgare]
MDACQERSLLVTPLGPPEQTSRWSQKKLTDQRVGPVLEQIISLVKARIKEFLGHCIAPLQAHSRPLWEFTDGRDPMRPHVCGVTHDELDGALVALLGPSPEDLPQATPPFYACDDVKGMIAKMSVFKEWLLVGPPKGSPNYCVVLGKCR